MYNFKKIRDIKDLKGKKVLLKLDLNLSLDEHKNIHKDSVLRVESILPTIFYLIDRKAKIVIISHLGRPQGKIVEELKMDPIAKLLSEYLGKKVKKIDSCRPQSIAEDINNMSSGDIILLENIRFYKEEEENDQEMAQDLAQLFDLYINDAFSCAHREHMSSSAITNFLPSYVGFKFQEEVENLRLILDKKTENALLILGGAKIKTKLSLIKKIENKFNKILLGGVMANTFLKSRNINIGKSVFEATCLDTAKEIDSDKIILPLDVLVSKAISSDAKSEIKNINIIKDDDLILDLGPQTMDLFDKHIQSADLILWNGPMGYFELNQFRNGTQELISKIVNSSASIYTGGGETITMLSKMNMTGDFDFVSTGGGAMLEFLSGNDLPALKALENNNLNYK